ncbi:MAG: extracellular solute-binding protein [Bacillota bacterium]
MKRIVAVIAMVLLLGLSGIPVARAQGKNVELRFLSLMREPNITAEDTIIKKFEQKHPNIKVSVERVPFNELFRKIATAVASGDPPDVMLIDGPLTSSYAFHGVLLPLNKYYTADDLSDFLPSSLMEGTYKGTLYSVPQSQAALALFYNTEMFKKAGIQPPKDLAEAWTWPVALEMLKKVTVDSNNDGIPEVWGISDPYEHSFFSAGQFIRSNATPGSPAFELLSDDGTTVSGYLDAPEVIEAMQFYQDMHLKWKVKPQKETQDMFWNGKSATMIRSAIGVGIAANYPNIPWSVTPLPYFKTGFTHTGAFHYAVAAKTKHPDEAALLLKFLVDKENAVTYSQITASLPARKSAYARLAVYDTFPLSLFRQTLAQWGYPRPSTPAYREYESILTETIRNIAQGADVRASLKSAVARINLELKKYSK